MNNQEEQAKEILLKFGVRENQIQHGSGVISVSKRNYHEGPKILSYEVTDTTPMLLSVRPNIAGRILDKIDSSKSVGLLSVRDRLQKSCVKYIDPSIALKIYPLRLKNIKWHALSFYLEGDIETKIENRGKEGEKGVTSAWFFEDCPTSESQYDWSKVRGSADFSSNWTHKIYDDKTGSYFGKVKDNASPDVGKHTSASAHWRSGDLRDLIDQIFNILLTGGITTKNGFDVSYSWEFNGTHTKSKHIDARVWVPVSGDLTWLWD